MSVDQIFILLLRKGEIDEILSTSAFMKELQNQIGKTLCIVCILFWIPLLNTVLCCVI